MNINNTNFKTGENIPVMVFRNDKETKTIYNIGVSKKVVKDNVESWVNGYILAQFNKDISIENKTKIILKNAILDFYINKDNQTVPFIRVFEYETVGNEDKNGQFLEIADDEESNGQFLEIADDEVLPF